MFAVQIIPAGGVDQDRVTMPEIIERIRQFGLVLRHAERDFQYAGVSLKLIHCADAVRIQRNDPQLDPALDLEISCQFGERRCFSDSRRSQKSENGPHRSNWK